MDRPTTRPMLLARIPDLNAVHARSGWGWPVSSGRVISQALSFKLLAAAALLLVAVAIVPLTPNTNERPSEPSNTLVSSSPAPTPCVLRPTEVASHPPAPASTDMPLMSSWPNPAHPTSSPEAGVEQPHAGVNQAMAIRPLEHIRNRQ